MEWMDFENKPVQIQRKWRRKTVSILLSPQKPIVVRTGLMTPKKVIYEFLLSKKDWILKNLEKFKELDEKFPQRRLLEKEIFPFLGQDLHLKVSITPNKKLFMSRTEQNILLHVPMNQWSAISRAQDYSEHHEVLRQFYKRESIAHLTERLNFWSKEMGVAPTKLSFREPKGRWGSCSSKGSINLNWRLILFKPEVVDYVIIHELCHLRHLNHSKEFWALVEKFCPQVQFCENELKQNQLLTQFLDR
jgi:predicted metal-dependent hydrolase